ncbi:MAG: 8-amino-7-oxononanoate synthase [Candidatus Aureabacteria bacterium]|nr:8-amino-7-oxononanoate synthase [Candidatus Auribacterota bacterium]
MEEALAQELDSLRTRGLYRSPRLVREAQGPRVRIDGKDYLCFCSNNYLDLAAHPEVKDAASGAIMRYGWGSGASRLISGTMELHTALEKELADFKRAESAILFPSGYMANLGVISALVGPGDTVAVDKLDHASIIDGCRLSGARLRVYPHGNTGKLDKILRESSGSPRRLVVTDSIFSMDGDLAPLEEIARIARQRGAWLMVDEAHATGVLGAGGRGAAELLGVEEEIPISLGTLSKALGGSGGFVAGSSVLIDYLRNKARSFIYTTAPPPATCAAAIAAIRIVRRDAVLRESLISKSDRIRNGLAALGFDTMGSSYHIIPVLMGEASHAIEASDALFRKGILAPAIRPPTVPRGKSRIRITATAAHTDEDIECLLEAFRDVAKSSAALHQEVRANVPKK